MALAPRTSLRSGLFDSAVSGHSFDPDAWILLIWDCSQVYLNEDVARHLRCLGILVIVVPAKLTWLLQVLDVLFQMAQDEGSYGKVVDEVQ